MEAQEALAWVKDGATLALGGLSFHNEPAALVRFLVKRGVKELTVIPSPAAAYCADLLLGVGAVKKIYVGHFSFEHLGLAPNFRRMAEAGRVEIIDANEAIIIGGLLAAAEGIPAHPVNSLKLDPLAKQSGLVKVYRSEEGEELAAVKALAPDVALIHAQQADPFGNVRHLGATFADCIMARAAKKVIVSVDELVSNIQVRNEPWRTTVPSYQVDTVVEAPFGAHPTSSHMLYLHDEEHLRQYLAAGNARRKGLDGPWSSYLQHYIREPDTLADYLERVGGKEKQEALKKWESTA